MTQIGLTMSPADKLAELQTAQEATGRRAIILFEGPEGSAKKRALQTLVGVLDPCRFMVHSTEYDRREAADGHWLARFWCNLPAAGQTRIFFRSWYRRVLDDRLLGRVDEGLIPRAFDEINEFEAQQRDYGTILIKLYFDVSAPVQRQRLAERASAPWAGQLRRSEPLLVSHVGYRDALNDIRRLTDTRWSPWHIINADDEGAAASRALEIVAAAFDEAITAMPPQVVGGEDRAA